ncbi:60S ribosomal subunit assembly or modification protein [Coemansia sp. RSA 2703]|nr:60S ribosomal subunit assembly or modification protein [Coemansia sp. RSA 2703]KAJ2376894.1 60S ribosomal subunit assembly or modification protein [Coemansia sp. RSA 2607]
MSSSNNNNIVPVDDHDVEETYIEENEVEDVVDDGDHMEAGSDEEDNDNGMNDDDDDGDHEMQEDDEDESGGPQGEVLLEDDSVQGFFAHKEPVFSVDLHPQQQNLVASGGGDDLAYLWRLDTGDTVGQLEKHDDSVVAVKFSNDGSLVASGGMDGKVNVYRTEGLQKCSTLEGPDEIQWINWHPKGNVLLAGANDASMWMWSLPTGDFMNVFNGHGAPVTCGRFTNSGKHIVSGAEDGSLIIWDPKTAAIVRQFSSADERFHQEGITALDISRDDQVVLTGSLDSTAKLVHVNGTVLGSLENASESVEAVGLCEALPLAATGSVDGSLSIWDINTMRLRTTLNHDDSVTRLLWHDKSPLLTSVSIDCTVRTWDSRTGECVHVWKGHQEGIMDFALSRDGKTVVTASDDGCCLVFSQ